MAPCGGCFNPHVFRFEWMSISLPPSATFAIGHGVASPPGAALWGPQGCGLPLVWADRWAPQGQPQLVLPYNRQGRAAAPAPPVLLPSLPCYRHLKGQCTQHSLSGTTKPSGAPLSSGSLPGNDIPVDDGTSPGSDIPLGSDVPMDEGTLLSAGDIVLPEEVRWEEAVRHLDCSLGVVGDPSSIPMPRDPG
ncbi:hypothetical protein AS27_11780, partial [Aptenodytes forsteri]